MRMKSIVNQVHSIDSEHQDQGNRNLSDRFVILLMIVACALLGYLCYQSATLALRFPEDYSERMELVMIAGYIAIFVVAVLVIRHLPERVLSILTIWMLIGVFCVQVHIAYKMQVRPDVDLKYIIEQNEALVANGEHIFTDRSYFAFYTNNIGIAIVVYWVYRVAWLCGLHNCALAGGLFNVCMNMLTYICAYRIVRRFCSKRVSVLFLFLLVTNPVLYAYASYYYTDTVSMGITMAAVDVFLAGVEAIENKGGTVLLIFSGFLTLIAFRIRVTSLIIVIAALVYGVMKGRFRQMIRLGIPFLIGVLAASVCYNGVYHYHIDYDTSETAAPWQHWIAMGTYSEGDGRFNTEIYETLAAQTDHQSMVEVSVRQIQKNIAANGPLEWASLILRKEEVVWSRGAKFYFQYVANVKDGSTVYDWIVGDHSAYFANYMQAYNTLLLFAILASLVGTLFHRSKLNGRQTILLIYWLGAVLFYVLWEAHPRQSVSYLALMSMMIVPLIDRMFHWSDVHSS